MANNKLKNEIETVLGAKLIRGHILDGAGSARFGWGVIRACKTEYLGSSLRIVREKIALREVAKRA